jgi:hypothetical protein
MITVDGLLPSFKQRDQWDLLPAGNVRSAVLFPFDDAKLLAQ